MKTFLVFAVVFCSFLVGQTFCWKWGKRYQDDVQLFRQPSGDHYHEDMLKKNAGSEFIFPNKFDKPQFVITYIVHTDGTDTAHNVTVLAGGIDRMSVHLKIERRKVGPLRSWDSNDRAVSGMLQIYGIHKSCYKNKFRKG